MRADAFNLHVVPVRTEMTGTQNIPISHVCDLEERESKGIIADENLSQVFSIDKSESESFIVDESSMEEIKLESVHKSINTNKEKYTVDETEQKETLVTYNPVINELSYFNLFECVQIS